MRIRLASAAVLQLLVLSSLAIGQTAPRTQRAPVLKFTGSIPLGQVDGRIDHTSIDLTGHHLFSSAFDEERKGRENSAFGKIASGRQHMTVLRLSGSPQ